MTTAQAEPLTRYLRQVAATHLAADLSDRQLLERYASRRDEAAFTALVRRHGPLVLGVCRRVLRDAHAAEDAFQATFLVLARKAGAVGRPEALGPWLHGVAARVALKARSREARRRAAERRAAALAPTTAGADDPVWHELRPLLDEAIGALPDKLRTPFVLHYLEGRTVTAIARHLGCPRGTVATHLARARQRLRTRLMRRGLTLTAAALGAALSRQVTAAVVAPALPGVLLKTAAGLATGQTAAGAVPAAIVALAQGGLQTMSLSKQVVIAAALLLTLGAVGGTVLLAQGTATKEQAGAPPGTTPAPAAEETDLALFREGGKRFLAADYRGADDLFSHLVEEHPDSPLARQSAELAIISKQRSTGSSDDGRKVTEARRIIEAVLAGARAAEAGQERAGHRQERGVAAADNKRQAAQLMRQYHVFFKEGKYKQAEMCAEMALELDPLNEAISAALKLAVVKVRNAAFESAKGRQKEEEIEKFLQRPVNLTFKDAPLSQVLDDLRAWHGINIVIDQPALDRAGISTAGPVSLRVEGLSQKTALKLLLERFHLTYVVRDGVIVVTTPAAARGRPVTATYPVGDVAAGDEVEALVRLIQRMVAPETWAAAGGNSTINYYPRGKALVINQTPDVQEQIADFLAARRRLKGVEKKP